MQVCIYKGFCVKESNFAIIMKLYSYSLANRISRAPGVCVCVFGWQQHSLQQTQQKQRRAPTVRACTLMPVF